MTKKQLKEKEKELKEQRDLLSKSVEFWADQINIVLDEIEEWEHKYEADADSEIGEEAEQELEILTQKLLRLVAKGDFESEEVSKFEEKVNEFCKLNEEKEVRSKNSARKKKKN